MKINCPKCKHIWDYKGKSEYYITCPHCYRKLNIKPFKKKEKDENDR